MNINFFSEDINKSVHPGVYKISFLNKQQREIPFYIGESCFIVLRGAQHLGKIFLKPKTFGLTKENLDLPNITIKFQVLSVENDKYIRLKEQYLQISKNNPIAQTGNLDRIKNPNKLMNDVQAMFQKLLK